MVGTTFVFNEDMEERFVTCSHEARGGRTDQGGGFHLGKPRLNLGLSEEPWG